MNESPTPEASMLQAADPAGIRHVLRVALPLILASSGHAIRIFADRVMLSHYSPEALAASLPAGLSGYALMSLFIGTAGYCGTFVSQYIGAGRGRDAGRAVWQGVYLSLVGGLVVLAVSLKAEALFRWIGHPVSVQLEQVRYFRVLAFFTTPALLLSTLNAFWSGRGRTLVVMRIELFCAVVNVALNAVLIFGRFGCPAMGIAGAAYATGISSVAGTIIAAMVFLGPNNRDRFNTWPRRTFDAALFARLLRFGLPNGIQFFLDMVAFNIFIALMGRLGTVELAAAGMVFGLNALAFLPLVGLGMAASVFVGQGVGAGDTRFARRAVRSALYMALAYNALMALLFLGAPSFTLSLYAGTAANTAALDMARRCLRYVAAYLLFDALAILYSHAIRGAGDTRFALMAGIFLSWGTMVLPAYVALRMHAGMATMWLILVLHVLVAAAVYAGRYWSGRWESMQVIDIAPVPDTELDVHADRRG